MDLMQRRRELMAMQTHKLDTTLVIEYTDTLWQYGKIIDPYPDASASILYSYPASTQARRLTYGGLFGQIQVFKDGVYVDYWTVRANDTRTILNANSNQLAVNINTVSIENAYAYLPDTGQILFAGKNTPYYGYTNINDMPSA